MIEVAKPQLACHVAKYLNPADVFSLRRVSKRWKEIFTQKDILFYCARIISPKPCLGLSAVHLEDIIKRQGRLEIGQPVTTATVKDLSWDPRNWEPGAMFTSYDVCNGKLAYISLDQTDLVICLNLWTGEKEVFTIEDPLIRSYSSIHLSTQLLAVRLSNGRWHIWDLLTKEHKLFTEDQIAHYFCVSECNVFLQTAAGLVQFCFRQNRVHHFGIHNDCLGIRYQGCEKVYVLTLERTDGTRPSESINTPEELKTCQLVVWSRESQFTASTELQRHDLSSFLPDLPLRWELSLRLSNSFRNQLAGCIFEDWSEQEILYFSLSESGLITTHRFFYRNDRNEGFAHEPIHISQGVMYVRRSPRYAHWPQGGQVTFASGSMMSSMPPRTVGYDLKIRPLPKCGCGFYHQDLDVCDMKGDDQFLVLSKSNGVCIWGLSDMWRPSNALSEAGIQFECESSVFIYDSME
ncbi:hypothetical protein N7541_000735 [Penicillium brevicompactum]|uniref:F-box domain-containing protein n=1 Tax=Penicillium brevicompactum TaxID=5074 RepID=A0A9W9RWV2_PENBR|nr:hypothetical protein N7541_000735 [Penicillium brevicompactum]